MGFARCEVIEGCRVVGQSGMLPDFLALGAEVIENDDLVTLVVECMKKACRGAIPWADGRACGEPIGIDIVGSGDKAFEGFAIELRFGNLHGRARRERAGIAVRLPVPRVKA